MKALEYQRQAFQIREVVGDSLGMGASLNSIGSLHMQQGDFDKAYREFQGAQELHELKIFANGVGTALSNIGTVEAHRGNNEQALEFHDKSFLCKEYLGDKQGMAI